VDESWFIMLFVLPKQMTGDRNIFWTFTAHFSDITG